MKKYLLILFIAIISFSANLFAQTTPTQSVPGGMLFQAVAKDNNASNPASNRDVYAIVTILKHEATGSIEYSEDFKVTSGNDGIFTLVIGKGINNAQGPRSNLYDIDWGGDSYFLNIKIAIAPSAVSGLNFNPNGNYQDLGTSQLWTCLLYTSPSPRDYAASRMPSSA